MSVKINQLKQNKEDFQFLLSRFGLLKALISCLFFAFFFSCCPSISTAQAANLYEEAVQLLKDYYFSPIQIAKSLNDKNIDYCRNKVGDNSFNAIKCLTAKLNDPYTKFLTPDEAKKELKRIKTITSGSGLVLDLFDNSLIVSVQADSPAAKAGIKARDQIVAINDVGIEYLSETEINGFLKEAAIGKKVNLDLKRGYHYFSTSLTIAELTSISIRSKTLPSGVLYIKVDDLLSNSAPQELKKILSEKKLSEVKGIILDLKGNKGGLLSNGINISDLFLSKGKIVSIKSYQGSRDVYAKSYSIYDGPLVVLTDGKTASASEVIAAGLRDNKRALLIGSKTFGKGLVQQIKPLTDGSALHITVNKFYTPLGQEINRVGIQPNVSTKDEEQQLKAALEYFNKS